ncbi:uncharacterized protein C594.04c-like [Rosa rugosa]|uniref:uncharacterized protein C594.04c-like n=1 Tax=Rosa rugosa TaxID=74645 RepID=UPI002B4130F9|nr:uncharacterized protein C594.04c-like [Rosa rugosa]
MYLQVTTMASSNLKHAVIAFLAPSPSILFYLSFLNNQSHQTSSTGSLSPLWEWCYHHPLLLVNALFFLNVNVLFWVISQVLSNHWMISLYWTVIPVMLVHYYRAHPLADYDWWRSIIAILMTWVWSLRMVHNYFRRENWQWSAREDWRFTNMTSQYGKHWWWASFFAIYLSQQVFLIGLCLPMYVIHSVNVPMNIWDFAAIMICISGIAIAYYADTQLYNFASKNKKLKALGEPVVVTLDEGLWRYSRHPNYFGEQLWWWGLAIFAWNLGHGWTFIGSFLNTMCLAYVTKLVEQRMLEQDYRAEAYRQYQKTTSVWIPWFKASPIGGKDKKP